MTKNIKHIFKRSVQFALDRMLNFFIKSGEIVGYGFIDPTPKTALQYVYVWNKSGKRRQIRLHK